MTNELWLLFALSIYNELFLWFSALVTWCYFSFLTGRANIPQRQQIENNENVF